MKSVRDIDVSGKKVLVRVDYNLPMDDAGSITDDNRIQATLPLLRHLIERQAKIILASHMGRPKGKRVASLSLRPAADRLSTLLGMPVAFADDCIGPGVEAAVAELKDGEVLLLENLRFHVEETDNNPIFSKALASVCQVFINEAFSVSHRSQASVVGITDFVSETGAGFQLEKELLCYRSSVQNPKRPLVAVIGGAKVSSKLEALENMLNYVDTLIIGGAMANTFLKSQGINTGASLIEEDLIETAGAIVAKAEKKGIRLLLPVDLVVADAFEAGARSRVVNVHDIPDGWMGLDIGPAASADFAKALGSAQTIVWNGPMGVFEMPAFSSGTCAVADAIAASGAFSVVGGGDTGLAVKNCNAADRMSYISTGGGAFLHLMEGKDLPGVVALEKN